MTAPDPEPVPVSELPYAQALTELEVILDRLEHTDPDVDRISTDVARAAELVRHCRGRIDAARLSVEDVVAELTADDPTDPGD